MGKPRNDIDLLTFVESGPVLKPRVTRDVLNFSGYTRDFRPEVVRVKGHRVREVVNEMWYVRDRGGHDVGGSGRYIFSV